MDVNALHKDELEFELACRGVSDCKTVATMRKFLREMLRLEETGESTIAFKVPIGCIDDPNNEILICKNKLSTLVTLIAETSHNPDRALYRRIQSRVAHLANRAKLIKPTDQADIAMHLALLKEVAEAISSLEDLKLEGSEEEDEISEHDRDVLHRSLGEEAVKILGHLSIKQGSSGHAPKEINGDRPGVGKLATSSMDNMETRPNIRVPVQRASGYPQELHRSSTLDHDFLRRKLVPIRDWGVKFSGKGAVSINAFLERITELKEARNADEEDLFRYAIDLFEEEALIWFRANRSAASSWSELVELLIDTFQKPNYQEEPLEEIRRRTQSKQERVVIYLSVMQNMFNRLPVPLSELQKLIILRRNLQPYFQKEICRDTFSSVAELTSVLRVIEQTKITCESFREPTQSYQSLEQDLAYQGNVGAIQYEPKDVAAMESNVPVTQSKCWNCRSPGHRFRDCNLPRQRLFCYKCGRFGNTVQKCACSNGKQGNGNSESMPADRTPRNQVI